ncbi:MAG TPA: ABC transporter permease [Mycobacteriales bacterium]|nr:ABC transporter permease [Mycobacteriales bacterium]
MSSTELAWRVGVTVRTGFAEYRAANPPAILLTTTLPRAVLQCLFFTLLGRAIGGPDGARFAYVGAVALILTLATMASIGDVPMLEKWSGTFYRLQGGVLRPATTFFLRALPWVAEAVVSALLCIVIVGPATGQGALTVTLLAAFPLYAVMAVTAAAAGAAVAAPAVGRRADVLFGNVLAYLTVACCGALIPAGRVALLDAVGTVLPLRNGILAVRAVVDGAPWAGHLLAELAVGAGWALLGWILYAAQTRRSSRLGIDDFA